MPRGADGAADPVADVEAVGLAEHVAQREPERRAQRNAVCVAKPKPFGSSHSESERGPHPAAHSTAVIIANSSTNGESRHGAKRVTVGVTDGES